MEVFTYTLTPKGQQPIKGMGSLDDLQAFIIQMNLPGTSPADWIVANPTIVDNVTGALIYIHDEGGPDEWRLRWVRFA